MPFSVSREVFETLAEKALATMPKRYLKYFKNVSIHIEDYPDEEVMVYTGLPKTELLGLFTGPGYANPGFFDHPSALPDSIILYQKNLEAISDSEERLIEEIRITVVHEVGHYFGLSDDDLAQYDY
jgi:predicted Zn-dependent protease with MMP-like domain